MSGIETSCYSCNQQLYLHDHVVLKPCQCIVCPKCLLSAHAARGTTLLSCGKCGIKVNAHEFVPISGGRDTVAYGGGNTNDALDNEDIYATAAAAIASNNATAVGDAPNEEQQQTSTSTSQEEQKQTSTKTSNNKKPRKRYPRPKCKEEGCNNYVQSKGVCVRHGAPTYNKKCSHPGCNFFVRNNGVCITHGAKVSYVRKRDPNASIYCSIQGCKTRAKRKGGTCQKHDPNKPPDMRKKARNPVIIPIKVTAGKLGLGIKFYSNQQGAVITTIHDACSFKDQINVGDRIVNINGVHAVTKLEDLSIGMNEPNRIIGIVKGYDV